MGGGSTIDRLNRSNVSFEPYEVDPSVQDAQVERSASDYDLGEEALNRYFAVSEGIAKLEKIGEGDSDEAKALKEEKKKLEEFGVRPSRSKEAIGAAIRDNIESGEEEDGDWKDYLKSFGTPDSPGLEKQTNKFSGDSGVAKKVVNNQELKAKIDDKQKGKREENLGKELASAQTELEARKKELEAQIASKTSSKDGLVEELAEVEGNLKLIEDIKAKADDKDWRGDDLLWGLFGGGRESEGMMGAAALDVLKGASGAQKTFLQGIVDKVDEDLEVKVDVPMTATPEQQEAAATETVRLTVQGEKAVNRLREVEGMMKEMEANGLTGDDNYKKLQGEKADLNAAGIRSDTPPVEAGLKIDERIKDLKETADSGLGGWRWKWPPWDDEDVNKPAEYLKGFEPTKEELEMARADGVGEDLEGDDLSLDSEGDPMEVDPAGGSDAGVDTEYDNSGDMSLDETGGTCSTDEASMEGSDEISSTVQPGMKYTIEPGKTIWEIAGELKAQGVKGTQREIMEQIVTMNADEFAGLDPMGGDVIRLPLAEGQMAACDGEMDTGYTGPTDCNWDEAMDEVVPGGLYTLPEEGMSLSELAKELQAQGVCGDTAVIMDLIIDLNRDHDLMPGAVIQLPDAAQSREAVKAELQSFKVSRPIMG